MLLYKVGGRAASAVSAFYQTKGHYISSEQEEL